MIAEVSAMIGFIGGIGGAHPAQIVHQVDAFAQHAAEVLAHPVGFLTQGREYELVPVPGQKKAIARPDTGFLAELCRNGNAPVLAELDVNGGFHNLSMYSDVSII